MSSKGITRFFGIPSRRDLKKKVIRWLILGLIIRLVLMPITAQIDLINNYVFAHFIVNHGMYDVYSLRGISNNIALLYPPLAYYYMAGNLYLASPFLPSTYPKVFDNALNLGVIASGLPLDTRLQLIWNYVMNGLGNGFYVFAFLVKLPLLFFDLGCAFILLQMIEDKDKASTVFKFWMINPIVILITYMQGQFDIIPAFLILLSVFFIKQGKMNRSFFSLGLSIAFKLFPVLLVPFNLLLSRQVYKKPIMKSRILLLFVLAVGPLFLSVLPFFGSYLSNLSSWQFSAATPGALSFQLSQFDLLVPYAIVYALLLLFAWQNSSFSHITIAKYGLAVLLSYYALNFFHPQFFIWVTPLIFLLMAYTPNFGKYFLLQLLTLFIYTFNWGNYYGLYLFTPIYRPFFSWPSPKDLIGNYVDPTFFLGIVRSFFSAICLWMIWEMIKTERKAASAANSTGNEKATAPKLTEGQTTGEKE